jgi:hypothetical protein
MVPYLGVNLSDLTFTEDGNDTYTADIISTPELKKIHRKSSFTTSTEVFEPPLPPNFQIVQLGMINFTKFKLISQLLTNIQVLQKAPLYQFPKNDAVEDWLLNSFVPLEEGVMYTLSKQCEPRIASQI